MESTKTYVEQVEFWYWGQLFALSSLVESARKYCLELILKGKGKLECNKELQTKFNINKRWANSVYTEVQGIVTNIDENRNNHIKALKGQIQSVKSDIRKREKQIKDFAALEGKLRNARSKKGFSASKSKIKRACNISAKQRQSTQLQDAKFGLHQKKRKLYLLENQLKHLTSSKPNYVLPDSNGFMLVGSKDETSGNQSAQFDYNEDTHRFILSIRTPYALENRLGGQYIRIDGLNFKHGHHEIIEAISERCYQVKTKCNNLQY